MAAEHQPDVRYVVIHRPGPKWVQGVDFREQSGVIEHVKHYRAMYEAGQLDSGGPYLKPDSGGMMIPVAGLSEEAVRGIAAADPAVQAGLLVFEIVPWYVAMKRT
jgi:uncharacterized protein YciI